jgi:hypothetical protein
MRWSVVLLVLGIALTAFGLYWAATEVNAVLAQERNSEACTAFPCGDVPPPPIGGVVVAPGLVVLAGVLPLTWGIARIRHERRDRLATSAA